MNQRTGASSPVLFWIALALLVAAPLVWGGNRPWPLLALEVAGLAILATMAWTREAPPLPATLRWGLALLLATPLLQLVPVPASWWASLPGHAPYATALDAAGVNEGFRAITIHPRATEYAWLVLVPCIAVFLAAQCLGRGEVRTLLLAFVAVACGEAVLGILQVGAGKDSLLLLGNPWAGGGVATGTYINKNHFAGLMAMALPLLVAFWAAETLPQRDRTGERLRSHPRHADAQLARRIGWSLLIVLVLAALLFTRSRAGIGFGLAAFAGASAGLVWSAGTPLIRAVLGVVAALGFLLAAYVGLTPVLERFAPDDLSVGYEGRLQIARAAMRAGLDFLPLGSGLGTFADVFRRYQDADLVGFVDHAHNDYAEAFVEMGVAGLTVIALLAIAYASRWATVASRRRARALGFLQVSAGLSVLALALHGGFDFNFHIPANAIYFSFLAGVFFYEPSS
jgi:O-antigen ligase